MRQDEEENNLSFEKTFFLKKDLASEADLVIFDFVFLIKKSIGIATMLHVVLKDLHFDVLRTQALTTCVHLLNKIK